MDRIIRICDRIIRYSFYSLFFLVPLAFTDRTSELFEFNKMWLTFFLTILVGASWFIKAVAQKKLNFKRTPLDVPIILFLLSQVISTVFSLDTHVSIWGYYSRFNGGLLSIVSYIFLYYAFLSNLSNLIVTRLLKISLASGLIVALWGLPSHFGFDPTCFIFRGSLDVSCWTEAFQPKIRIFSTLGQPDWMAAYMTILIPIALFMFIKNITSKAKSNLKFQISNFKFQINLFATCYLLLTVVFYLDLIFTDSRSGFFAIWISIIFLIISYLLTEKIGLSKIIKKQFLSKYWYLLTVLILFGGITFIAGTPFHQFDKLTLPGIKEQLSKPVASKTNPQEKSAPSKTKIIGGTESGEIRTIVWRGALDAFVHNPIFGTGVETFAFAYYKYRPPAHNLTSEWDFLYNKAHNEYLNYLATTGIVGLGTYLLMIGAFLFIVILKPKAEGSSSNKIGILRFAQNDNGVLILALLASYLSILITNFFGFSVVIVNLYLFMIPAFVFALISDKGQETRDKRQEISKKQQAASISGGQWIFISVIFFTSLFLLFNLIRFWQADTAYALGYNLDRAGQYQQAYPKLQEAVAIRGDEPVFKDELSINDAILASALASQKEATTAAVLLNEAINTSNELTSQHPNNIVFAKTRVRVFYALSQIDPQYQTLALDAIIKAKRLAPTDAKISYNLGILYGQNGNTQKAVEALEETVKLKPDYRDAYYALGLFYRDLATDKSGNVVKPEFQKKAVETMKYLLKISEGKDEPAQKALKSWGEI